MNHPTVFVLLALVLTALCLAWLLPVLWRGQGDLTGSDAGIAILREQMAATQQDLVAGRIDAATADRLRTEIARRLLEEQGDASAAAWQGGPARATALIVGGVVIASALLLYVSLGAPQALSQPPREDRGGQPTQTQVEAMLSQMTQALEAREQQGSATPEDGAAWALAGRTLASLQRFAEADKALARALALTPNDASVLADRADIMSLLQGQNAEGEPMKLITRALQIDSLHPKALALAGSAAFARGDAALAVVHWRQALAQLPPESDFARNLSQSLAEAQQAVAAQAAATSPRLPAGPKPPVLVASNLRGRLTLAPALAARTQPGDTVFIVARAAQGPRMPLAILRLRVSDLPADFVLDDSSAMSPAMRLSAFNEVVVTARISRAGDATPAAGDLVSAPLTTTLGQQGLAVSIDRLQP